jgi:hypothetical protein
VQIALQIGHVVFGDHRSTVITTEPAIDIVLYNGPEKELNFAQIREAAIIFTLSLSNAPARANNNQLSIINNQSEIAATLSRPNRPKMSLTVPTKPLPTKPQRKAAKAKLGRTNPWKASTVCRD